MRIVTTIGLLLAMSAVAQAETIFYGSRAGEEVTITDKSNIDSADARIAARLTKPTPSPTAANMCRRSRANACPTP
ncbi:hypothetical protein [Mesorhizobium amorphae]|uniref:hypothetical protein n=1 Tax=Mesorhizobium amorphae TaxID=71433 RepID=UPI0011839987|nr:hypothetical protein [Mesorhizobium amorphae]